MAGYLPAAAAERAAQYAALGLSGPEALYRDVPESVRLTAPLNLPPPQSELEVRRTLEALAEQNLRFRTILRRRWPCAGSGSGRGPWCPPPPTRT